MPTLHKTPTQKMCHNMHSYSHFCQKYECLGAKNVVLHRRGSRIQKGGFVQEFRLENRSYPDVHDFSLRMQVIIAND